MNAVFLTNSGLKRFFCIDVGVKAVCLICHEIVAVFKEYNLKLHFQTKHANFGHNLSKQELQKKVTDLVKCLKQQQSVFEEASSLQRNATRQVLYWPIKLQSKTCHLQKPNLLKIA